MVFAYGSNKVLKLPFFIQYYIYNSY